LLTVEDKLCEFIVERLGFDGAPEDLTRRQPLELPALLDSEEVLEMVTWIEEEFDVEIEDEEINGTNFLTVPHLVRFVESKLAVGS